MESTGSCVPTKNSITLLLFFHCMLLIQIPFNLTCDGLGFHADSMKSNGSCVTTGKDLGQSKAAIVILERQHIIPENGD